MLVVNECCSFSTIKPEYNAFIICNMLIFKLRIDCEFCNFCHDFFSPFGHEKFTVLVITNIVRDVNTNATMKISRFLTELSETGMFFQFIVYFVAQEQ